MKNSIFKFKHFQIDQSRSAMKIGTDGVLLGAWTPIDSNPKTILDVGTGTGLIALMLAQRLPESRITAVEIEKAAAEQAFDNFTNSSWSKRLCLIHDNIIDFSENSKVFFDLIVSNPPFFKNSFKISDATRSTARDNFHMSYEDLFSCVNILLSPSGSFAMVCPIEYREELIIKAELNQLYLERELMIKGTKSSSFKRILMQFSRTKTILKTEELILEESRNHRTFEHQKLVNDFYL